MNDPLKWFDHESYQYAWVLQVFVVVFIVALFNLLVHRLIIHLKHRSTITKNPWDNAFLNALERPLSILLWIVGIAFAAQIVKDVTSATIFDAIDEIRDIGVVATLTWFLVRLIREIERSILEHRIAAGIEFDRTTLDVIGNLSRVSVIITGVLVALQSLGYSISGVLAFGGIGGIAVGFAAKDMLANFFGSMIIFLDRPFAVGDWICSPDREIEGVVEQIGWRLTVIRTFDKRPLYVPNSTFTTMAIENPSRMTNRRIHETIGIRYQDADKMSVITRDVKEMLVNHPEVDTDQILMVFFNRFAPSSLDFEMYFFTKTIDWEEYHNVKHDIMLRIFDIIRSHGADIAFPTSTIHIPEEIRLAAEAEVKTIHARDGGPRNSRSLPGNAGGSAGDANDN